MIKKMFDTIWYWITSTAHSVWDKIVVLFFSILGYLSPVESITHLVLLFFLIDVIYGWRADKKLHHGKPNPKTGEIMKVRFRPGIVWEKTMPRVLFSVVALILSFMLDEVTRQKWIETHLLIGWAISALLFLSILKNAYIVTNWNALPFVGDVIKDKVEKKTGIKMEEE